MYCKHCGKPIDENAAFCSHCGKATLTTSTSATKPSTNTKTTNTVKKKSIWSYWWIFILAIFVNFFVWVVSPSPEPAPEPAPETVQPFISEAEFKSMCNVIAFNDLARNPNSYRGQFLKFTGEVIQVMEDDSTVDIRMNVTAVSSEYFEEVYYEDTIYVILPWEDGLDRILEEDIITVYGKCAGLYKYTSVLGHQVSLPLLNAKYYEIVGD